MKRAAKQATKTTKHTQVASIKDTGILFLLHENTARQ